MRERSSKRTVKPVQAYSPSPSKKSASETKRSAPEPRRSAPEPKKSAPEKRKSTASSAPEPKKTKNEYVVEKLLSHRPYGNKPGKYEFLVRWEGFNQEDDTWEPEGNLSCGEKLKEYKNRLMDKYAGLRVEEISEFDISLKEDELQDSVKYLPDSEVEGELERLSEQFDEDADRKVADLVKAGVELVKMADQRFNEAKFYMLVERKEKLKERQVEALKELERVIAEKSPNEAAVTVENEVDNELPPSDFTYISANIPGEGVTIPDDPLTGCECGESCGPKSAKCCPKEAGSQYAYSVAKRVTIPAGIAIYECNKRCNCPETCTNRVVQLGRKVKVGIFKTENKGWGVRANEPIKKGTYVCDYVGEIITNEEAERRGKGYDAVGRTYLFDLDFAMDGGEAAYVIDAAKFGNVSHFINHSCEPNLATYVCYSNCLEVTMPQIAFFALRDIKKGEELTFDYSPPPRDLSQDEEMPVEEEQKETQAEGTSTPVKKLDFGEPAGGENAEKSGTNGEVPNGEPEKAAVKPEGNGEEEKMEVDEGQEGNKPVADGAASGDSNGNSETEKKDNEEEKNKTDGDEDGEEKKKEDGEEEKKKEDGEEEKKKEGEDEEGEEKKEERKKAKPVAKKKVAQPAKKPAVVVSYSPHNGARGYVGIKAYGSPGKPKREDSEEEESPERNNAAMICRCGAKSCRGIVFLWGKDAKV